MKSPVLVPCFTESMPRKSQARLLRFVNWWGPFLGAGIRLEHISPDFSYARVSMNLHWWNRNYVGTHYGGSLYSMADPFFMLMVMERLGPDYIVWDKAASIRFRRPGRGKVTAEFHLSDQQLNDLRLHLETAEKIEPVFSAQVIDEEGAVVAEVEKTLYIRRKK